MTLTVEPIRKKGIFSEYKIEDVCSLYDIPYHPADPLRQFPRFDCTGEPIDDKLLSYIVDELQYRLAATPIFDTSEAYKSVYVYFILLAIVRTVCPMLQVLPERYIEDFQAKGKADYSIEEDGEILGVTEVKRRDYVQGVAQNAMQIRPALEFNRRRAG